MQCVPFVHNVPQVGFWSAVNKLLCLFHKSNGVFMYYWSTKHPYFIIMYSHNSGGLAAMRRETTAEAAERV